MGDIKSAREIAMERVEELGEATEEERLKWKYVPQGEELAVRYIKQRCNLVGELSKYEKNVRGYIIAGAEDVLISNIGLPKNDSARKSNKKVMDGLKTLKSDKVAVENIFSKMRNIFNHYVGQGEQQRKQAYESLKAEFESKMQEAIRKQMGLSMSFKIDVEKQPQFQVEWRKVQIQLDLSGIQSQSQTQQLGKIKNRYFQRVPIL